jgi:hypothetical protein
MTYVKKIIYKKIYIIPLIYFLKIYLKIKINKRVSNAKREKI